MVRRIEPSNQSTIMIKSLLKTGFLSLLAAAIAGPPAQALAQNAEKAGTEKKESAAKKQTAGPFHGKLAGVDKTAKTITIGKRTFQITSESKISKAGKPATLEDAVVGEVVSGHIKTGDDGKLVATTVRFGPKAETKSSQTKKEQ